MARVKIVPVSERKSVEFPAIPGVSATGKITSSSVVTGEGETLFLWSHDLAPQATLRWEKPPVGHGVFVQKGDVLADGKAIGEEGAVIIEHGGTMTVQAGAQGAILAHFHSRSADADALRREGGHAHAVGPEGIYSKTLRGGTSSIVMFADSTCKTCQIWLHRSNMPPELEVKTHYHTENEVIFVVKGLMVVGRREHGPGTALAIDARTTYGFKAGDEGLSFINFRATDAAIAMVDRGKTILEPVSERELVARTLPPEIMARVDEIMKSR